MDAPYRNWSDLARQRMPHFGQRICIHRAVGAIPLALALALALSRKDFLTYGRSDLASIMPFEGTLRIATLHAVHRHPRLQTAKSAAVSGRGLG